MASSTGSRSAWSRLDSAALRRTGAQARAGARASVGELRGFLRKPLASFYLVLVLTAALVAFGLVMMASASAVDSMVTFGSPYYLFTRQLIFVAMGIVALIVAMRMRLQTLRRLAPMMMIVAIALLALVLVPGVGVQIFGARRWFDLGITLFQPSEFGKVAFLIWGAHVLVQRKKLLDTWGGLLKPILPGLAIVAGLIVIEPDLHSTVVYLIIFLTLLWVVGTPMRLFGLLGLGAIGVGIIAIATQGFRLTRVTSFLNPWSDPEGAGHQALQGFYALGTGGLFGVGLGNSRTKWGALPNSHSDYIFAIIGEELGMVGALTVLALFVALAYTGMRIAQRTSDLFIRLVSSATVVWLCAQALINVGYVVGLLPVTGITLPLISSGGTSLVMTMFAMGTLANCARHEPAAVRYLQTRRRRFGRLLSLPVPPGPTVAAGRLPATRRAASGSGTTRRRSSTAARSAPSQRRAPARSAPTGARSATRSADRTQQRTPQRTTQRTTKRTPQRTTNRTTKRTPQRTSKRATKGRKAG